MSTITGTKIAEPIIYHREYRNDLKGTQASGDRRLSQCVRLAKVALPFIALYKPISQPLSIVLGSVRIVSSAAYLIEVLKSGEKDKPKYALLQTSIAVAALASEIFAHPVGMLVTTGQDLIVNAEQLLVALKKHDYAKALETSAHILNNSLHLALFFTGGLEILAASLSVQILLGLYESSSEFKKGNYLEGSAHLLMAGIRTNQLKTQLGLIKVKWEVQALLEKIMLEKENPVSLISDIPESILLIYQKYSSLSHAISDKPTDALLLLKHHLFRPDVNGADCLAAVNARPDVTTSSSGWYTPLELVQMCLPSKKFLIENPQFIDKLYKAALSTKKMHVIGFLSNPAAVENCYTRDLYFLDWFNYEVQKLGANPGEVITDFFKKKNISGVQLYHFISKCPEEVRKLIPGSAAKSYEGFWNSNEGSSVISSSPYLAYWYNLCPVQFYGDAPSTGKTVYGKKWEDSFSQVYRTIGISNGDQRWDEVFKKAFPSEQYCKDHPEKLNNYLDDIVWQTCYSIGYSNPYNAVKILKFMQGLGIDLNQIVSKSKHKETAVFLKNYNLI